MLSYPNESVLNIHRCRLWFSQTYIQVVDGQNPSLFPSLFEFVISSTIWAILLFSTFELFNSHPWLLLLPLISWLSFVYPLMEHWRPEGMFSCSRRSRSDLKDYDFRFAHRWSIQIGFQWRRVTSSPKYGRQHIGADDPSMWLTKTIEKPRLIFVHIRVKSRCHILVF